MGGRFRVGVKMRQQNELTKKGIGVGGVGVGWEMKRDNRTGMKFDLLAGLSLQLSLRHKDSFYSSQLLVFLLSTSLNRQCFSSRRFIVK